MILYYNPYTRCAIATEKDLAVFLIIPVDMDPLFYAETVMDITYDCQTPFAFCQKVHPLPPYPSRLPPPSDQPDIPPIRIAPDQTIGVAHPASDMEEVGGGAASPAPANTPSHTPNHGASDASITSSPNGPAVNDVTPRLDGPSFSYSRPKRPPPICTEPMVHRGPLVTTGPRRSAGFGISKPYGGRY